MSTDSLIQQNQQLIRDYFNEVWNKGHLDILDNLLTSGYLNHSSSIPDAPPGPAGLKPIIAAMRIAFPDLHYLIQDLIVTDNRVVARVKMSGTHTGDLFGIAPTNKKISVNQINIEYIENGKISQHWRITDEHTMMQQLGLK
jgi:steroid delta-isomerase-like uncharacterized protein